MKIGLIDVDGRNFPNIPLMKISAYHKAKGDVVEWYTSFSDTYDIVYGPIANDKIGLQMRKLKDGNIDKAEFLNRLKYMQGATYQYYFGTESAIKYLKRL